MTAQEKINQLALAALRSTPPQAGVPQPTTYMAPFEKPKAPVVAETPAAPVAQVEAPAQEAAAIPFKDEPDLELRAQIEEREVLIQKKRSRQSLAVTLSLLGLLAAGGITYSQSPKLQAEVASLVPALRQSASDVKMIGSITKQYDKHLEKISVHGDQIEEATKAMGIDTASVAAGDNSQIDAEMQKLMGEEGRTTGTRDKDLQQKFGFVEKLAGDNKPVSTQTTQGGAE